METVDEPKSKNYKLYREVPMHKILAYQCQMAKNSLNLDEMGRILKVESMPLDYKDTLF